MPNWVRTKLTVYTDTDAKQKEILEKYTTNGSLDFEKIIPMPKNIYRGPLGASEREEHGKNNWYDWCWDNWGTKWNACHGETHLMPHSVVFEFDTAWSFADPIVCELAQKTGCDIDFIYADEDLFSNLGTGYATSGGDYKCLSEYDLTDEDKDEIVFPLWGYTREMLEAEMKEEEEE